MNEANKVKLGGFLLLSATLLTASFIAVGVTKIFEPKYHAMTVLNTSVEGLAVGSPVKYLGMPVGRITRMTMREKDGFIAVYFDISPSTVETAPGGESANDGDVGSLIRRKNMKCFLNAAGLMGGSYLELSADNDAQPALPQSAVNPEPGVLYVPAMPSHIGNAIQNVSRMLDDLAQINFAKLISELNETLENTNELITRTDLKTTLDRINNICASLEKTADRMQQAMSEENLKKLDGALTNFDGFLSEARTMLGEAKTQSKHISGEAAIIRTRLEQSLTRLDNLMKQCTATAAELERDPSQFVRGRQEPPLHDGK
ncbi:MAG: MlaD family protein [Victivallaceae bacterium]|nr:MlaD family protein [Victivallaceae bacterium]